MTHRAHCTQITEPRGVLGTEGPQRPEPSSCLPTGRAQGCHPVPGGLPKRSLSPGGLGALTTPLGSQTANHGSRLGGTAAPFPGALASSKAHPACSEGHRSPLSKPTAQLQHSYPQHPSRPDSNNTARGTGLFSSPCVLDHPGHEEHDIVSAVAATLQ